MTWVSDGILGKRVRVVNGSDLDGFFGTATAIPWEDPIRKTGQRKGHYVVNIDGRGPFVFRASDVEAA